MVKDIEINESEEFRCIDGSTLGREPYPAVTFSKHYNSYYAHFNAKASKLIEALERVTIMVSDKHILFSPPLEYGRKWRVGKEYNYRRVCCKTLSDYLTEGETYRAYPYKGGLAIDREPIKKDATCWGDAK